MTPQFTSRLGRLRPKIPNEIRRYRLQAGFTQQRLAEELGVGLSTLTAWERGVAWPSRQYMLDLAIALSTMVEGLYPEHFFGKKRRRTLAAENS